MEEMTWFQAPSKDDAAKALKGVENTMTYDRRTVSRFKVHVPVQIQTSRGSIVNAMMIDISCQGMGVLHRGPLSTENPVEIRMSSEMAKYLYQVQLLWTEVCDNGMWRSGGKFTKKPSKLE